MRNAKSAVVLGFAAAAASVVAAATPAVAMTSVSAAPAVATSAVVAPTAVTPSEDCGYLGFGRYNHCGPTTVMVQAAHVFGSDTFHCVRPGITELDGVSNNRWGVTNAWYIGGVNCFLP